MTTGLMITGLVGGAVLLIAFAAVLLECTYDAGFEEGYAAGRRDSGKEAR